MNLHDVVTLGSVDAVVALFRNKEVRRFGFLDTDKRLGYLQKRLQMPTAKIFDWSHYDPEVRRALAGKGAETLRKIFDDRHAVVHADKFPLAAFSDLEPTKEFLDKVIMNTALVARDKTSCLR